MALELVQAQHQVADCESSLAAHKAQLADAKARQQARLIASLDARLQAMNAALNISSQEMHDWSKGGHALLQDYAALLKGHKPFPGAFLACHGWRTLLVQSTDLVHIDDAEVSIDVSQQVSLCASCVLGAASCRAGGVAAAGMEAQAVAACRCFSPGLSGSSPF
jgi:hypothetical protein